MQRGAVQLIYRYENGELFIVKRERNVELTKIEHSQSRLHCSISLFSGVE